MTVEEAKAKIFHWLCSRYHDPGQGNEYIDKATVREAISIPEEVFEKALTEFVDPGAHDCVEVEMPTGPIEVRNGRAQILRGRNESVYLDKNKTRTGPNLIRAFSAASPQRLSPERIRLSNKTLNASLRPLLVRPKDLSALPAAKLRFIEPMYARLVNELPKGRDWLYEVKFDGYRCLAGRDSSEVTLWSRRENLFTKQFPQIAQACERLPPNTLVDGEIVALDEKGRVSFNLLQHHRSKAQALLLYVFDVLIYRGRSLLNVPLSARREILSEIFKDAKAAPIALSESLDTSVDELVRVAKEFGFEGIVAKRKDSVYEPGKRSGAWVKYRVNRGQEFVIGGYTPGNPFDALVVGYYEGERLFYAAKVRNGFVPLVRREVASRFKGLATDTCPFANLPERRRTQWALTKEEMKNCVWLKPELVAQIEFTEWTLDGHLRHSKFVGLREDKGTDEHRRGQGYLFLQGQRNIRVDPNNGWIVESGYPKPIPGNWSGFSAGFATVVRVTVCMRWEGGTRLERCLTCWPAQDLQGGRDHAPDIDVPDFYGSGRSQNTKSRAVDDIQQLSGDDLFFSVETVRQYAAQRTKQTKGKAWNKP